MGYCNYIPQVHGCGNPSYNIYSWDNNCCERQKHAMYRLCVLETTVFGCKGKPGLVGRVGTLEESVQSFGESISALEQNMGTLENTITSLGNDVDAVEGDVSTLQQNYTQLETIVNNLSTNLPIVVLTQDAYDELVSNGEVDDNVFYYTYDGEAYPDQPDNPDNPDNPDQPDNPDNPDVPTPIGDVYVLNHVLYVPGTISGHVLTINGTVNNHTLTL